MMALSGFRALSGPQPALESNAVSGTWAARGVWRRALALADRSAPRGAPLVHIRKGLWIRRRCCGKRDCQKGIRWRHLY